MAYDPTELINYMLESCEYTMQELDSDNISMQGVLEKLIDSKDNILSIYYANKKELPDTDPFLTDLITKIEKIQYFDERKVASAFRPKNISTRDNIAVEGGIITPAHLILQFRVVCLKSIFDLCNQLKSLANKLASHISNLEKKKVAMKMSGVNIFIGHGRSSLWRELKDFIHERLRLPYEEFNRTAIAGLSTSTRLSDMLNNSCMAFLVMTAEDENADGAKQARMNVIHEVGLFQGRLGFEKAIVLLEDGCEEFSNINGLGQIRFPRGKISAVFEEIREVLKREKIIDEN